VCSLGTPLRVAKGAPAVAPLGLSVVVVWAFWMGLLGCRYVGEFVGMTGVWYVCGSRFGLCCRLGRLVSIIGCGCCACIAFLWDWWNVARPGAIVELCQANSLIGGVVLWWNAVCPCG
jgi:hypothetical protein